MLTVQRTYLFISHLNSNSNCCQSLCWEERDKSSQSFQNESWFSNRNRWCSCVVFTGVSPTMNEITGPEKTKTSKGNKYYWEKYVTIEAKFWLIIPPSVPGINAKSCQNGMNQQNKLAYVISYVYVDFPQINRLCLTVQALRAFLNTSQLWQRAKDLVTGTIERVWCVDDSVWE